MKKILIYGDSNVWGDGYLNRLEDVYQWSNVLAKKLGADYKIIQEGLPGRIAGNEEKIDSFKNGMNTFLSIFRTAAPVDMIIIALGTNDLQIDYHKSSEKIINDLLWYKNILEEQFNVEKYKNKYFNNIFPEILFILPPNFKADDILNSESENKRQDIINYFSNNKESYIVLNDLELCNDELHFSIEDHKKMADTVYNYIVKENII